MNIKLILLFLPILAFSQKNIIKPLLKDGEKWENYYDRVPVSGEIRVGILAFQSQESLQPSSFFVNIPDHKEKYLCVEISSKDGKYEANLTYDVARLKKGVFEFELPTKHLVQLRKYKIADITILSKIGNRCNSNDFYFVFSAWNKPNFKESNFYIHLNSEKPTYIETTSNDGITRKYDCTHIPENSSIAYNCQCIIPLQDINSSKDINVIQRVRIGGKISYNSYPFPIRF